MGLRWIFVDEPWMLDRVANEERLNMTFEKLFSSEINETLPGYLKQIYRFFGLWVSIIGLFIVSFLREKFIKDSDIRKSLLICTGLTVYLALIFAYIWIPSSPFIYLGCFVLCGQATLLLIYLVVLLKVKSFFLV